MKYQWMKEHPDSVIELNVHGDAQYQKVVMERLTKITELNQKKQEEEQKRQKEEQKIQLNEPEEQVLDKEIEKLNDEIKNEEEDDLLLEDKQMVETDYVLPKHNQNSDQAQILKSFLNPDKKSSDEEDEGFISAFSSHN